MDLSNRLGLAGLIVALIGIGVTIMWPTKRWVANVAFGLAFLLCGYWGITEYRAFVSPVPPPVRKSSPTVTVNGDCSNGNTGDGNTISVDCSNNTKRKK
jgi:hypothetical protein